MEKNVNAARKKLVKTGKSTSKCKQTVNNRFFLKRLLIYMEKYAILTRLDALTAEVAARR